MAEVWLPISDFPDYDVSDLGRVRSWRGNGNGTRAKQPKVLRPTVGTNGYLKYELCRGERRASGETRSSTKYIHKLVCELFIGPCPKGMETCHLDGDQFNNVLSNLSYATHQNNLRGKMAHGTNIVGSQSNFSKLNEVKVKEIRNSALTPTELAERYGVSRDNIYLILARKTWRHV